MQVSKECFKEDKDTVFQKLRDKAIEDPRCGQTAVVERKAVLAPKSDFMIHAVVTDIVEFESSSGPFEVSTRSNGSLKMRNEGKYDERTTGKRSKVQKHDNSHRR